jgi:RNA polymerase sigma factor (sigma-70 family)
MIVEESKVKWNEFLSGSENAYCWIYRTYIQLLYQYGLRFTPNKELIKDCIQEIFIYIYKNRKQLSSPENVKVYLFICLKHNLLRALAKESPPDIPDISQEELPYFSLEPTVEDIVIEQEQFRLQRKQIKEMLSMLTSRQQEIIYYRYIQELSFDEICELMDLNYQSAQNLIQRSLKKLRDNLGTIPLLFIIACFTI